MQPRQNLDPEQNPLKSPKILLFLSSIFLLFFGIGAVYLLISSRNQQPGSEIRPGGAPSPNIDLNGQPLSNLDPNPPNKNEPRDPQSQSQSADSNFLQGSQYFESADLRLKSLGAMKTLDAQIQAVDLAIIDLEKAKQYMQAVDPNHVNYPQSQKFMTSINQHLIQVQNWKQEAIRISVAQEATVDQAANLTRRMRFPELSIKHKSVFLNAMKPNTVALTFDDGPTQEYTPQILEILRQNNTKATFFVVGKRVRQSCDLLRQIYQEGHEIGNHTDTHPYLTRVTKESQRQEIQNTQLSVNRCLNFNYPMNWFRAPYGDQNPETLGLVRELGLNSAQWVVDTLDWKKSSSMASIRDSIDSYSNPGVILMHDGSRTNPNFLHPSENPSRQNTIAALEPMLKKLKNRGFSFVTLSGAF
jgi:peptidoglycan/xylan/chitin deacetylase (PgdA/CDA1 family)